MNNGPIDERITRLVAELPPEHREARGPRPTPPVQSPRKRARKRQKAARKGNRA